MNRLLSPKEVRAVRNIGRNELQRLCHCEDYWQFGHKEGNRYKIDLEKLDKYLERRTKWNY